MSGASHSSQAGRATQIHQTRICRAWIVPRMREDVLIMRQWLKEVLVAAKQERQGHAALQRGKGGSFATSTDSWQENTHSQKHSRRLTLGKRSAEELKPPCTSESRSHLEPRPLTAQRRGAAAWPGEWASRNGIPEVPQGRSRELEAFPGESCCHPPHGHHVKGFVSAADKILQGEFQDQQNVFKYFYFRGCK